jgi:Domain of unknown function (DUF4403)
MRLRTILLGVLVLAGSFIGATLLMNVLWPVKPSMSQANRPVLVAMPLLQPLTGTSVVLAPAAIALSAIRDALEAQAPRNLSGTPQNPVSKLLSSAKLTFTVNRGPLAISGQPGVLLVTTPLSGQFEALGTLNRHGRLRRQRGRQRRRQRHRRRRRPAGAKSGRQGVRSAHRHPRHGDDDGATRHCLELAHRAEPFRPGQCRRRGAADRWP